MSSIGDTRIITIATRATNASINFTIVSIGTIVASVNSVNVSVNSVNTIRDSRSITKIAIRSINSTVDYSNFVN